MQRDLSRQSFLGMGSEHALAGMKVAIVGLCGGGSHVAQQLAHVGIGEFALCDPDIVEASNLNRMVGATYEDAMRSNAKAAVVQSRILSVNPSARIFPYIGPWQSYAAQLRGADAVFGCVDSFVERAQLEAMCRRFLIPYIDVGMDVTKSGEDHVISGQVILSMPGHPCMRCMGFLTDSLLQEEVQRYGVAGGKPQVVWPNGVLASTAVGIFISIMLPWKRVNASRPLFMEYDGNSHSVFPSRRVAAISCMQCKHFNDMEDLGDPFFEVQLEAAPSRIAKARPRGWLADLLRW